MYEIDIDNTMVQQAFDRLQIETLVNTPAMEILRVSLAGGAIFPPHGAPRDLHLVVLEGEIEFHIRNQTIQLTAQQHFSFSKEVEHWVQAVKNAKFLIIR